MPDHPDAQGEDSRAGGGREDGPQTDESERWRERYDAETVLTVQRIWSATSREDVARYVWEGKSGLVEALSEMIRGYDVYPCVCEDAYKKRGLVSPYCCRCNFDGDVDLARKALSSHTAKPVEQEDTPNAND